MASLLETFGILFESDSKEAKKDVQEFGDVVDEFGNKMFDAEGATEDLDESLKKMSSSAKRSLVAVVSAGAVIAGTFNAIRQADQIGKFSDALGLNVEELDAWGQAVIRFGGTAEGFQGVIGNLTTQLTEFSITGGGQIAETFALLGISAFDAQGKVKPTLDVLLELSDVFSQLGKAEAVTFGQKLGLDQGTILLLQQGRREVNELIRRQKELGTVTREDTELAAKFNSAWADTRQIFNRLFLTIGSKILPTFNRILNSVGSIIDFLDDHKEGVITFFTIIAGVVTAVYLPAMLKAAAATIVALAPFILIGLAITAVAAAIALLVDDIIAYNRGQKSLIGTLEKSFPAFKEFLDFIKSFKTAFDSTDGALNTLTKGLRLLPNILGTLFPPLRLLTDLLEKLSNNDLELGDLNPFKIFGLTDEGFKSLVDKARLELGIADNNGLAAQTSNTINNNRTTANRNTNVSVGSVNVNAPRGDSTEISRNISNALSDQMQNAVNQFDDGVVA